MMEEKTTEREPGNRIQSLDVLRTVGLCGIAIFHFFGWNGIAMPPVYLVVDLCFVITGYTTMIGIYTRKESTACYIKKYVKSRFIRLWIPYIFCWLITVIILLVKQYHTEFYSYFVSFFLLQSVGFTNGGEILGLNTIGVCWPLSAEVWVGLFLFPMIYHIRKHPTLIWLGSLAMMLFMMNAMYANNYHLGFHMGDYLEGVPFNLPYATTRCVAGICGGIFAFYMQRMIAPSFIFSSVCEMICLALCGYLYLQGNFNPINTICFPILALVLIYMHTSPSETICSKALGQKIFKGCSKLYYPILLVHPFVYMAFKESNLGLNVALFLTATVVLAKCFEVLMHSIQAKIQNFCFN